MVSLSLVKMNQLWTLWWLLVKKLQVKTATHSPLRYRCAAIRSEQLPYGREACHCSYIRFGHKSATATNSYEMKVCFVNLQVDIKEDLYPAEISWELLHGNGDMVIRWARTRYGPTTEYSGLTAQG